MLAAGSFGSYQATNILIDGVSIPSAARAVTGIVTATGQNGDGVNATGTLAVVDAGIPSPTVITVTLSKGSIGRGYYTTFVDSTWYQLRVKTSVAVHLIIDITGFFAPIGTPDPNAGAGGLLYYPITPLKLVRTAERLLFLRFTTSKAFNSFVLQATYTGVSKLQANTLVNKKVAGVTGTNVPLDAKAVNGAFDLSPQTSAGSLTVWRGPSTTTQPAASASAAWEASRNTVFGSISGTRSGSSFSYFAN